MARKKQKTNKQTTTTKTFDFVDEILRCYHSNDSLQYNFAMMFFHNLQNEITIVLLNSILSALCSGLNEGKSLWELIRVAEKHSFSRSLELVRSCLDFRAQIMPPFGLRNLMRSHLVCELEFPRPPFDSKALSPYESTRISCFH